MNILQRIADDLSVKFSQVEAAVGLLDDGATVPFVARYRKEATGGLDDTQLRTLEERLGYLRELEERRTTVLGSIADQGKLTDDLKKAILDADTKTRLEDLYLPYKPKRRTKAQIAREAGIEPLLDRLLSDDSAGSDPQALADGYLNAEQGFADAKAVLDGARQIFMERAAEQADLVGRLREHVWEHGVLQSRMVDGQEQAGAKYADYFDYQEPIKGVPSHRALALFRGRKEQALRLKLWVPGQDDKDAQQVLGACEAMIARHFGIEARGGQVGAWLLESVRWSWSVKLAMHIELESMSRLRERAEEEAIRVFGENLRDLLLAAPAGPRATMGLDPGLRTGVKVAVVDATGKLVATDTIYPHAPRNQWDQAIATLAALVAEHRVELISIGNGTASRETDRLVADLIKRHPQPGLRSLVVSEAGASVYSASETAAREFPQLDVSLRGAVSIARRLQDPLAELVKIEPKSIGVGQYQHDVSQVRLARTLDAVVEDCVNAVGVDVNTASAPLLARVAGLSAALADNVVGWRDQHGAFQSRDQLLAVPRLGPKAFQQAAGFLRIANGSNPLDASAVHPEAYPVVERILAASGRDMGRIIGDRAFLHTLAANDFTDERFGEPTVRDIIAELEKPGRDPRPEFRTASFKEGIEQLSDLEPGMVLEGVVTNVTNFGAFVDIGVHQDGLVHVSALAEKFVKDPREVVKAGDVVKVKVMTVDLRRKRAGLSMRLTDVPGEDGRPRRSEPRLARGKSNQGRSARKDAAKGAAQPPTAMAEAFARLKR
ncbi:MAG: Tex family protein [Gammaproteobacteria bacterium]